MTKKRYPAIILTVVLVLFTVIILMKIYNDWKMKEIEIEQPIVNLIQENSESLDLKSIIHEAEKSVVQIEGHSEDETITGSGFIYNDKGDIVTNAHVIENAEAIYVKTADARFYPAAIIGMSEQTDIALLRVPHLANQETLPFAEENAEIGDEVIALGSPHGFQNTVTIGIISGIGRDFQVDGFNYSNAYQISAQITHGNSGGPLIKRETGEIIGINSVGTKDGTLGFSIPIQEVMEEIKEWSNTAVNEQLEFATITDIVDDTNLEQGLQDAIYLTEYFWDSIAIRDYISAYSLLGSSLQQSTSYAEFRNQYIHIIDLRIKNTTSDISDNNRLQTTVDVDFIERKADGDEEKTTPRSFQFTFVYENDQLKITSIKETTS